MTRSRRIETERLILRVHGVDDYAAMCAMWSDPAVTRYIRGYSFSREEVWGRLLRYSGTWTLLGYGFWAICDKDSGAFIGEVGFHELKRAIVPPFGDRPELGFGLAPHAHGKGFATEAARAALDWGDSAWGSRETVCMIAPENAPSLRIASKLGYVETARAEYKGGQMVLLARHGQGYEPNSVA